MQLQAWQQVAEAITTMAVRGAPAIGIAAAWGVVLAARSGDDITSAIRGLRASRPTAVNLGWALNRMQASIASSSSVDVEALAGVAAALHNEDRLLTQRLVDHGVSLLPQDCRVLHHCHTGGIATGGIGTALGVIAAAHERGFFAMPGSMKRVRLQGLLFRLGIGLSGFPHRDC